MVDPLYVMGLRVSEAALRVTLPPSRDTPLARIIALPDVAVTVRLNAPDVAVRLPFTVIVEPVRDNAARLVAPEAVMVPGLVAPEFTVTDNPEPEANVPRVKLLLPLLN